MFTDVKRNNFFTEGELRMKASGFLESLDVTKFRAIEANWSLILRGFK